MKIFLKIYLTLLVLMGIPLYAYAVTSPLNQGGTGWNTSTTGDLVVGTSSPLQYTRLPIGSTGQVLWVIGGKPAWTSTSTLGIISSGSSATTTIFSNATSTGPNFTFATSSDANLLLNITGSSSTVTFNPQWNGVLAVSRGGIGTTTLGNLTVGSNLSITGGQQVLIGTSTQISLSSAVLTTSTPLTTNFIPIATGVNTLGNSSFSQVAGTTFINGSTPIIDGGGDWLMNIIQTSGANIILQTPTSTTITGNFIQSGGISQFSTSTNITGLQFICGLGLYYLNSTSSLTTNIKLPDLTQLASGAATGCGGGPLTVYASQSGQAIQFNASTSSPVTVSSSGTGETLLFALGSGPTSQPGQAQIYVGSFVASSTISGPTTAGMSLNFHANTFQPRATNPTMQGQFLMASSTASGGVPEWTIGNLIAGTGISVTTSTAAQITIAVSNVPTGSGTVGFNSNWTTNTSVGTGKLIDNGTVLGMNATSSTIGFNIQGAAGTNDIFNLASSSTNSVLKVTSNGFFTWQPTATSTTAFLLKNAAGSSILTVDTTSIVANPSAFILTVASSTGTNLFNVDGFGNTFINHLIGSSTLPTIATSTGLGTGGCTVVLCQASVNTGSTDLSGFISAGTGTGAAANATIATLSFNRTFTAPPFCSITNASSTTATIWATTTTTTLILKSNTALTSSMPSYSWYYQCIGQLGG